MRTLTVKSKSFLEIPCSISGALELIGNHWSLLIIRDLALISDHHGYLWTTTDVSTPALCARLERLIVSGIVERVRYQGLPSCEAYRLTEKGRDLWTVCLALQEWGDHWNASGCGAPPMETVDRKTGRPLKLAIVDAVTGRAVPPHRIELRPGPGADDSVRRVLSPALRTNP
ncbi:winged helix-turn-helix transcriptional regulator [Novosphingobium olei]|uniref:Helix-turn-helix transcriptional regulator n=1 Tax=Novosphingobium olei TaxID=2728851 RepID=A0A7Y0GD35_9SPHN|nr:helix-turn-helix transcriptional regulator [Novosphingobium olei]